MLLFFLLIHLTSTSDTLVHNDNPIAAPGFFRRLTAAQPVGSIMEWNSYSPNIRRNDAAGFF
jgi:hypothetical protein